ncbi:hypothetical protein R1flu_020183 [Riccia fluitans]|uniref:Uncharacterized protein n=1 Tax=Riccia fluitans TaxID=41844 RepID=A0ABD1ZM92_9MARC
MVLLQLLQFVALLVAACQPLEEATSSAGLSKVWPQMMKRLKRMVPAQICSVLGSDRFTPPFTSFIASPSLSLIAPLRLVYSNKWRNSQTRYRTVFCVGPSEANGHDTHESSNPDNENFSIEETDFELRNGIPAFPSDNPANRLSQEQLRDVLNSLSQSLSVLSSALSEVSSAVRVLSASLSAEQQQQPNTFVLPSQPSEIKNNGVSEGEILDEPPEPWDTSTMPTVPTRNVEEIVDGTMDLDSSVPKHLVEQNRITHKLAYKLQQSFIQARIDGLGKPFEVAVEEFADTCMEAHQKGIGLKELQLQLILQDGSLKGAFALRNQRFSNDPIFDEDSRIRSLWVRLVYSTIAKLEEVEIPTQREEPVDEKKEVEIDGTETFVEQVIKRFFEESYDLARIKLEQNFAGETTSPSIKAMRQNHYLVLLVVDKLQKLKNRKVETETEGENFNGEKDGGSSTSDSS